MEPTRILVVDDDPAVRQMLTEYLSAHGYEVREAASGAAMRAELERAAPAVVLLDIGLPGMDGFEVAAALRREPGRKSMRVISMSGLSREGDVLRALESGVDQHLSKPVEMRFLLSLLGPHW